MKSYAIALLPTHNEVTISGAITTGRLFVIMEDLARTPGFPNRHAIWNFGAGATMPPFPEFKAIIELVRRYLHPGTASKRVALVVDGGLNRALLEMFRTEAAALPMRLRVFIDRESALAWIAAPLDAEPRAPA